jgi:hypothetical protein
MANTAVYSALKWSKLTALTTCHLYPGARVLTLYHKVVELAGHSYTGRFQDSLDVRAAFALDRRHPANDGR